MFNGSKGLAAAGSAAFFVLAPGVVAGLIPWWLTGWRVEQPIRYWAGLRVAGGGFFPRGGGLFGFAVVPVVVEGGGPPPPGPPPPPPLVGRRPSSPPATPLPS